MRVVTLHIQADPGEELNVFLCSCLELAAREHRTVIAIHNNRRYEINTMKILAALPLIGERDERAT